MARLARVIAPGMPHHVTQRGNRRQQTFFGEEDYQHYLELMAQFCRAEQVAIWAYCLTPTADPTACAGKWRQAEVSWEVSGTGFEAVLCLVSRARRAGERWAGER